MKDEVIQALEKAATGFVIHEERRSKTTDPEGGITEKVEYIQREVAPNVSAAVLLSELEKIKKVSSVNTLSAYRDRFNLVGNEKQA